ncbi:MAG: IS110 family transposase [Nitrospinota bacterium]
MNYMGVDYHKKYSSVTVADGAGRVIRRVRISNTRQALGALFEGLEGPCTAVMEASRNWMVMHDMLEEFAGEVKLAHPLRVKAIASARVKTDEIDSKVLADLLRAGLIPEAHVPSRGVRLARSVLRQRMFYVRLRTMVKNRVHALVDRHPEIARSEGMKADLFGKAGMEWLRELELTKDERRLLDGELELLDALNGRIGRSERWVKELAGDNEDVRLLQSIPGIGRFFAVLLWSEIDGIERFANPKKLCSYAGLVPSTYSSGGKTFHGRITRRGNRWIRWAMVEAVVPAISSDYWLRSHYEHVKRSHGVNPAKVAVARRLLTLVYRILSEKRAYRPVKERTRRNLRQSVKSRHIPAAPMA